MDSANFLDEIYLKKILALQISDNDNRGGRTVQNANKHVDYMCNSVISKKKQQKILDLGCGIGHYTRRFSEYGHNCTGIDISLYAIEHAKKITPRCLNSKFIKANILNDPLPDNNDVIIFPYSIFNLFSKDDGAKFLKKVYNALNKKGIFYFEGMKYIEMKDQEINKAWYSKKDDFYCGDAHIVFNEILWNKTTNILNSNYAFISIDTLEVQRIKNTLQLYSNEEYELIIKDAGFKNTCFLDSPPGTEQDQDVLYAFIVAT